MSNDRPGKDILERTSRFAVRIVNLAGVIPGTTAGHVIGRQLMRCGTSVGANVEEAQGASTKKGDQ